MPKPEPEQPEPDYHILPDGRLVFTATYLLRRGRCCGSGCLNCPFSYINVSSPRREELRAARKNT